jgi:hypothetical protein
MCVHIVFFLLKSIDIIKMSEKYENKLDECSICCTPRYQSNETVENTNSNETSNDILTILNLLKNMDTKIKLLELQINNINNKNIAPKNTTSAATNANIKQQFSELKTELNSELASKFEGFKSQMTTDNNAFRSSIVQASRRKY